jgi:succinate dehydrogenase / fumarate reductase, cytochrome b subunit
MAIATPEPAVVASRSRTRLARLLHSSIGLKLVMAATGVILSGFVLGHMLGNLKVFEGADAINAYGRLLRVEPALLWTVRLVLLGSVGLHIWAYVLLTRKNLVVRPQGYRLAKRKESTFASRSMALTGPLLLIFIVYHILHMTTGTVHPSFKEGEVYHNLVTGLSVAPVAVFYVLAMAALGLHLWHGVWSLFQTLGTNQARYGSFGRRFATVFTVIVVLGFTAVPLSILAGFVK